MKRTEARKEKALTGQQWESRADRKRRLARANRQGYNGNAARLLDSAAAFTTRDDASRDRKRFGMIEPARGDGKRPTHKERQDVVLNYSESARSILGY